MRPLSDGFTRAAQTFIQNPQPSLNDAKHLFSAAFDTPAEADEFLKAAGRIAHNMALRAVKVIKSSREALQQVGPTVRPELQSAVKIADSSLAIAQQGIAGLAGIKEKGCQIVT